LGSNITFLSFSLTLSLSLSPLSPLLLVPTVSHFSSFFRDKLRSLHSLADSILPQGPDTHSLSHRRFIQSRKPDHAPWILFASSLVLRSCSRSKLRLPTALEVSRKSRRELYLSPARGGEKGIEGRTRKPISTAWRSIPAILPHAVVKQSERRQMLTGFLHLSSFDKDQNCLYRIYTWTLVAINCPWFAHIPLIFFISNI